MENNKPGRPGILFDLDGTLWDACSSIAAAWEEYVRLYEKEWYSKGVRISVESVYEACGKTMDVFTSILLHQLPEEEQKRLYHPCCEYEVKYLRERGGKLFPGVIDTLRELAGNYNLYIVSNCQEGYIEGFMHFYGIEDIISDTQDYGTSGLPKDENIRMLLKRNNIDTAVYVGDTSGDFQSTPKACLPFIFASYGFGELEKDEIPVAVITEFSELKTALTKIPGF